MVDIRNIHLPKTSPLKRVGQYTREEFLNRVTSFHGYAAPGVIVGGIMVDMAMEQISEGVLFDVICETSSCLPDAVQILTPCTIGNGWLRIINLGRYAVSLYDKQKGNGVRVYLDLDKLQSWQEIQAWLLKLKVKQEQDTNRLEEQIWTAGRAICTIQSIQIKAQLLKKHSKGIVGICPSCGEAYPIKDGTICLGCQGQAPYDVPISSNPSSI